MDIPMPCGCIVEVSRWGRALQMVCEEGRELARVAGEADYLVLEATRGHGAGCTPLKTLEEDADRADAALAAHFTD